MRGFSGLRRHAAAIAAVVVLAAAACSGGSSGTATGSGGGRSPGVGAVPATMADAVRGLGGLTESTKGYRITLSAPRGSMFEMMTPPQDLANVGQMLTDQTAIDLTKVTATVGVGGLMPYQVGILYGFFDTAAIGAKLAARGYHEREVSGGETEWVINDHYRISMGGDPLGRDVYKALRSTLNVVRLSPSRLVFGGSTADVDGVADAAKPLAARSDVASVADCLGAARQGMIEMTSQSSSTPTPLGVALLQSGGETRYEFCLPTASDSAARALAAAWPDRIRTGKAPRLGNAWSSIVDDPSADVVGGPDHVVRLSARSASKDSALLFLAVFDDDTGALLVPVGS